MNDLHDPIVIDPPGFDMKAEWDECNEAAKHIEGPDGEVNWKAAFSADPGVVSCPNCCRMHWAWGYIQRCTGCSFEYPINWWSMYSWGVSAAKNPRSRYRHDDYMKSHYYRYGFEHPVEDAWAEHDKIPWRDIISAA